MGASCTIAAGARGWNRGFVGGRFNVISAIMGDTQKLARLAALREEAAAIEAELGIAPKTFGYSREEAAAAAGAWHPVKNPDEPQFYTLDDQAGAELATDGRVIQTPLSVFQS